MTRQDLSEGFGLGFSRLAVNQWAHVVGVFDGSSLSLYVDGFARFMPARGASGP
jgi:hypothetical protein